MDSYVQYIHTCFACAFTNDVAARVVTDRQTHTSTRCACTPRVTYNIHGTTNRHSVLTGYTLRT